MATPFEFRDIPDRRPVHHQMFGNWRFDAERLALEYVLGNHNTHYEIDLETISSSSEMLDWVMQVHKKEWGPTSVSNLLDALEAIYQPQANLCSCGADIRIENVSVFLKNRTHQTQQFST